MGFTFRSALEREVTYLVDGYLERLSEGRRLKKSYFSVDIFPKKVLSFEKILLELDLKTYVVSIVFIFTPIVYRMEQSERYTMVPTNLSCYDNMVIVTHAVSWDDGFGNCNYGQRAMTIIQNLCDGRNSCVVLNKKSLLGGSCGSDLKFVMYYSCQTGTLRN